MEGTSDGNPVTVCKIRGFTLSYEAGQSLNFETMKRLVQGFIETGGQEKVHLHLNIQRDQIFLLQVTISVPKIARLQDNTVVTRTEKKTYRVFQKGKDSQKGLMVCFFQVGYDKRAVVPGSYTTLPFGHQDLAEPMEEEEEEVIEEMPPLDDLEWEGEDGCGLMLA